MVSGSQLGTISLPGNSSAAHCCCAAFLNDEAWIVETIVLSTATGTIPKSDETITGTSRTLQGIFQVVPKVGVKQRKFSDVWSSLPSLPNGSFNVFSMLAFDYRAFGLPIFYIYL